MAYCILKRYKPGLSALEIFFALNKRRNCFFLDSSMSAPAPGRSGTSRYSFLGIDPFYILKGDNPQALTRLREMLGRYKMPSSAGMPPYLGGAVGFLSYDFGLGLEDKTIGAPNTADIPAGCFFAFYNSSVIVDHFKNAVYISCLGFPEKKSSAAKALAQDNLEKVTRLLDAHQERIPQRQRLDVRGLKANFKKQDYLAAVRKSLDYIRAGDIYQVNLSQRFEAFVRAEASMIYERLRRVSPTYFSAYFDAGSCQVLSASPERFLKLENGIVSTRPMKGTRPRSGDKTEDRSLRNELLAAEKDKAELMMIVDLERNDLGRACAYDSVRVDRLRELEAYATVFQTTASISGRLYRNKDRVDLLRSCFPGGSITGCPKIRAMEIIRELEPSPRGIYTGVLGYLSFSGNMDFNILIRTILKKKNKIYFHAGGGIVADSRPLEEYRETLVKARAMLDALGVGAKDPLTAAAGRGVFETMRAYQGKIVCFKEHLERLIRSCARLNIELVYSPRQLRHLIRRQMRLARSRDMRLRITIEPGKMRSGIMIKAEKYAAYPAQKYLRGFSVSVLTRGQVKPLGRFKITDRDFYERAMGRARKKGFDDALILDRRGYLSEVTRSNIFFVKDKALCTPSLKCGCLDGVTRRYVIDLAQNSKIKIREGDFSLTDLYASDEAFLTNSLMGIMPLTCVAGKAIGDKKCGALTKKLIRKYRCLLK